MIFGVAEGNNVTRLYAMTLPPPTGDVLKPDVLYKKPWKEIGIDLPGTFTNGIIGPPLFNDGLLYVVTEGGGLSVLDARTGANVYSKALESLNPRLTGTTPWESAPAPRWPEKSFTSATINRKRSSSRRGASTRNSPCTPTGTTST